MSSQHTYTYAENTQNMCPHTEKKKKDSASLNNLPVVQRVADDGVPAGTQHEKDEDVRERHGDVVDVTRLAHLGPAAVGHLEVLLTFSLGGPRTLLLAVVGRAYKQSSGQAKLAPRKWGVRLVNACCVRWQARARPDILSGYCSSPLHQIRVGTSK